MEWMVWTGAAISMIGLVGIVYSIVAVSSARKAGLDDDALRLKLTAIFPINIGSLLFSILGLMMVVFGVVLS
ncbi:hypothetical protein FHS72_002498 [Loktanella ponticola]|uniref:Uncharacterized protein n=1 Tax=Yoonia ponticola TaxID=1524255 RepID=A0A7W9BLS5_9RHOB|nr:hypothetical protein [Yoonia ponticola]MBB5722868.1 hypothetical protein [Yoonia ponticola]